MNERVGGQTLEEAWTSLSEPQKLDVADQVVKVRKKLRSVTSTSIQCVDQSSSYPGLLFFDLEPRGPFHSDQKLWDALALSLRHLPQQVLENLRKSLPMCEPYVLTHCDLNLGNIMVQDGKVVGILDWEYAAFFLFGTSRFRPLSDLQTRTSNGKSCSGSAYMYVHGGAHENAKAFWTDMCNLSQ